MGQEGKGGFLEEVTSEWHLEGRVRVHQTQKGEGFPVSGIAWAEAWLCARAEPVIPVRRVTQPGSWQGEEAVGRHGKTLPEGQGAQQGRDGVIPGFWEGPWLKRLQ